MPICGAVKGENMSQYKYYGPALEEKPRIGRYIAIGATLAAVAAIAAAGYYFFKKRDDITIELSCDIDDEDDFEDFDAADSAGVSDCACGAESYGKIDVSACCGAEPSGAPCPDGTEPAE